MGKLTLQDATKQELIQYFFLPEGRGGGYIYPASEGSFLLWLQQKRGGLERRAADECKAEGEEAEKRACRIKSR